MTRLTNRSSQPPAAVKSTFDFMKRFSMFATLAPPAVAQLRLVRRMKRDLLLSLSLVIVLGAKLCGQPSPVEKRSGVTYSAYDWSHDARHSFDVPPQPVGGMKALISRLDYPAALRKRHVEGVVRVQVSLDAAGHILSAQILKSADPTLDGIVLGAVRRSPWKPAMKAGKRVPCTFSFPVTFTWYA
jgi:TonB family protein